MDGVNFDPSICRAMPPLAPLAGGVQDFGKRPVLRAPVTLSPAGRRSTRWRRGLVFGLTTLLTAGFFLAQVSGLSPWGLTAPENLHIVLSSFAFFWIAVSMSSAVLGLLFPRRRVTAQPEPMAARSMSVALLIPVHNEDPAAVFGNAAALLEALRTHRDARNFTLYVLSDTRDAAVARDEWHAFRALASEQGDRFAVHYRRRTENTDRKTGNLADWVLNWGGAHEAMLVLDADSLMSAEAVIALRDALAGDPAAGLVQSWPRIIGAQSLFGRMQQFATTAHGHLLARGLALWSGDAANFWGHNAIIRTRAFAEAAMIPHLRGMSGRKTLIMSHDFVEAALLRRAGWKVSFRPDIRDSYEETPAALVDYVLRDRRWCRGNMQHLRLLGTRGLHPASRFHMLQGAVSYLLAPVWLALMAIWAFPQMLGVPLGRNGAPPVPDPVEGFTRGGYALLAATLLILFLPKILSALTILFSPAQRLAFGGTAAVLGGLGLEVVLSVLYAPILMVQQVLSVASSILFARDVWAPQQRGDGRRRWRDLLRFHAVETVMGAATLAGIALGAVTPWLLPVAVSLALAVPLSAVSGWRIGGAGRAWLRLDTPETLAEPEIRKRAMRARARIADRLSAPATYGIAAE